MIKIDDHEEEENHYSWA